MSTAFHAQPTTAPPEGLAVDVREDGAATVVALEGELCLASAPVLDACVTSTVAAGVRHLVLDLTDLVFVDARGLSSLVRAGRVLRDLEGTLELRSPRPWPYAVMETTGVTGWLEITDPPGSTLLR